MKRVTRTLRFRLTAWYGAALTGFLLLFGMVLYGVVRQHLLHQHDEPLKQSAGSVLQILNEQDDCAHLTPGQLEQLNEVGRLLLIHEEGGARSVFFQSDELKANPMARQIEILPWEIDRKPRFETIQHLGIPWRVLSLPYQSRMGRNGIIRVMEDMGDIQETLESLRLALLFLAPIGILISCVGGYWLSGKALAPVNRITAMAREIEASNLDRRLPHPGVDCEIGRLVETLNRMFSRLNASFESMKRFTADASHELRSPLATMRNAVDVSLDRPRTEAQYQSTLQGIGEEVDRLRSVVEGLLLLARADAGRMVMQMEPVRLTRVVEAQVEAFQAQAQTASIDLRALASATDPISGDERWLHQLLGNLLGNALKFTPPGGAVSVVLDQEGDEVRLRVQDSGPGIPEEDLDRVFERFFRSDPARSRTHAPGSGLGLSIAGWIVEAHGARIQASNRPEGGAEFTVWFPRAQDPGRA